VAEGRKRANSGGWVRASTVKRRKSQVLSPFAQRVWCFTESDFDDSVYFMRYLGIETTWYTLI
jgi:hypothetical protein